MLKSRVFSQMLKQHIVVVSIGVSLVVGRRILIGTRKRGAKNVAQVAKMLEMLDGAAGFLIGSRSKF